MFGQMGSVGTRRGQKLFMRLKKHGLRLAAQRKPAVWMDCWGNGSDAHFHTQHVTLQIHRSVNCKRLLTRESVSSRHNTDSFEPSGGLQEREETISSLVITTVYL